MAADGFPNVRTSKLGACEAPLQQSGFVTTDLNEIVHAVVQQSRSYLSERHTDVAIELSCTPRIRANDEQLADVLYALVLRAEQSIAAAHRPTGLIQIHTWFGET